MDARPGGGVWGLAPYGVRNVISGNFFENIAANLCNLVHFGGKICILNRITSSKVAQKIDAIPCHFQKWLATGSAAPEDMSQTTVFNLS